MKFDLVVILKIFLKNDCQILRYIFEMDFSETIMSLGERMFKAQMFTNDDFTENIHKRKGGGSGDENMLIGQNANTRNC